MWLQSWLFLSYRNAVLFSKPFIYQDQFVIAMPRAWWLLFSSMIIVGFITNKVFIRAFSAIKLFFVRIYCTPFVNRYYSFNIDGIFPIIT